MWGLHINKAQAESNVWSRTHEALSYYAQKKQKKT